MKVVSEWKQSAIALLKRGQEGFEAVENENTQRKHECNNKKSVEDPTVMKVREALGVGLTWRSEDLNTKLPHSSADRASG